MSTPSRARVLAADGSLITSFYTDDRTPVPSDRIADVMKQALVDIEDSRFYQHHGLDVEGTLRAAVTNVAAGSVQEGGSSLTQQLVKQTLLETADTTTPRWLAKALTCSASVASAAASSRSGSQACSCCFFCGSGPCRCAVGARLPVLRRRVRYRPTVLTDTWKVTAACSWVIPPSTAATTRSRRSIEYARMHQAYSTKQPAYRCEAPMPTP